jgi:hypothetical protein
MRWRFFGPGPVGLRNPCRRGSLRRLLIALPMVPGRSSGDSLGASLFFLFYPFPVHRGTQIHECCIKFRNDWIVHRTLSSMKKESESGSPPCKGRNWASISGSSVGRNPSSPRVPRYGRARLLRRGSSFPQTRWGCCRGRDRQDLLSLRGRGQSHLFPHLCTRRDHPPPRGQKLPTEEEAG